MEEHLWWDNTRGETRTSHYIRIKRSFARKSRLNSKELEAIERALLKEGIRIKIEPVADGIIIYHQGKTDFVKNLRASLAPFATFVNGQKLPSSYVEIFNSMTQETIFIAANNAQYIEMCTNVIQFLVKGIKETENPLVG